jgi:hypothetical protein
LELTNRPWGEIEHNKHMKKKGKSYNRWKTHWLQSGAYPELPKCTRCSASYYRLGKEPTKYQINLPILRETTYGVEHTCHKHAICARCYNKIQHERSGDPNDVQPDLKTHVEEWGEWCRRDFKRLEDNLAFILNNCNMCHTLQGTRNVTSKKEELNTNTLENKTTTINYSISIDILESLMCKFGKTIAIIIAAQFFASALLKSKEASEDDLVWYGTRNMTMLDFVNTDFFPCKNGWSEY